MIVDSTALLAILLNEPDASPLCARDRERGEHRPQLFKGNDFMLTDIEPALKG
jgi:uncharacterized protein with PIN domain